MTDPAWGIELCLLLSSSNPKTTHKPNPLNNLRNALTHKIQRNPRRFQYEYS